MGFNFWAIILVFLGKFLHIFKAGYGSALEKQLDPDPQKNESGSRKNTTGN